MFERFTERARHVVVLAEEEARTLKHEYVGTEHVLLGLLREEEGIAARVLGSFAFEVEAVRKQVGRIAPPGDEPGSGPIPFTPRTKRIFELALREALSIGHNYIGTEHLLLALVREREGVAASLLLAEHDADAIRVEVVRAIAPSRSMQLIRELGSDVERWKAKCGELSAERDQALSRIEAARRELA